MEVKIRKFEILQYPAPELKKKSVNVKKVDKSIHKLVDELSRLAKLNSKEGVTLVGLSAPQLGENINLFVYFDFNKKKYLPIVNPKLVYSSKELTTEWEGCASVGVGERSLFGPVSRAKSCKIEYEDMEGNRKMLTGNGYLSHIILHELDHLEGIIFLEKVTDPKMILTAKELDLYASKNNGKYPKV